MCRVIDFTKFRVNQRLGAGGPSHADHPTCGSIHIQRRIDGSRSASMTGVFADDYPYAIEALADFTSKLAAALRLRNNT